MCPRRNNWETHSLRRIIKACDASLACWSRVRTLSAAYVGRGMNRIILASSTMNHNVAAQWSSNTLGPIQRFRMFWRRSICVLLTRDERKQSRADSR